MWEVLLGPGDERDTLEMPEQWVGAAWSLTMWRNYHTNLDCFFFMKEFNLVCLSHHFLRFSVTCKLILIVADISLILQSYLDFPADFLYISNCRNADSLN